MGKNRRIRRVKGESYERTYLCRRNSYRAVKEALCNINYYDVADDAERIQEWLTDDTISICECRNKRKAVWVLLECDEAAVYVDTLEKLGNEEIEKELM
nr:MAG: hypothetical protein [Bacteriophage sp.]